MTNEEIIAKAFVDVVKAKRDLETYKKDPAPSKPGQDDSFMLGHWENTVAGMENTFAESVKSRYPAGDDIQ